MPDQDSSKKSGSIPPADPLKELGPQGLLQLPPEEKFLRTLVKFLRDRMLYPENHPQILGNVSNLQSTLPLLFTEHQKRTFVFIEDQVFVDDRPMTSTQTSVADIIKIFHEKQIDVLILHRGLTWEELRSFLDSLLVSKPDHAQKPAFHASHIEVGNLSLAESTNPAVSPVVQDLSFAVSKSSFKKVRFSNEAKIVQELYTDWNAAQEMLVSLVDRIMHALEKGLFENYQSFIPLGDLKSYDEYTYVHAINLSILTMALAESVGFPKDAIHAFGVGALLHDVGKTQVPEHILNKHGQLTPEEAEEMKKHPVRGAAVLLQYAEIPRIATIVAYEHHLKYDGTGYPTMKRKRTQHIASRFTAIADQFDAMRSNRPYREAMPPEKIYGVMQESRGTGLDPQLLDHFIAFMKPRKII
jgi:putative nucleotidyltransferase with HDIG domain